MSADIPGPVAARLGHVSPDCSATIRKPTALPRLECSWKLSHCLI